MTSSPTHRPTPRERDPCTIANLLVQPARDDIRARRAAQNPPTIGDLSTYGNETRVRWIANLNTHMAGGPALDVTRYSEPPELAHASGDSVMVASYQPTPLGVFWRTGRRDPIPRNNPGPAPFSTPSTFDVPPPLNRTVWAEAAGPGAYPGSSFYRHENPAVAGRFTHSSQARTIIWGWRHDGAVFTGRGRLVGLTPDAYDAVLLSIADCEAISQAAILCHESISADLCPNNIVRPGNIRWPLRGTIQEQRQGIDDFREGCIMHLATAAILLRGIPLDILQQALPPNWLYPSFPGGTFFDAIEAYGILDASFAGIIFDTGMPTLDHMPPLSLFAEWDIPYGWLVPRGAGEAASWLREDFAWMDVIFWDISLLHDLVRVAEQRSLEAEERRLSKYQRFALIHSDSQQEFESRVWTQRTAASKSIEGLRLEWIPRTRVRDEFFFQRMKYEEHFPVGTVVFRSWTDMKAAQDKAARRQGRSPESIPGTFSARIYDRNHPAQDSEDEDDIDDDPQVILRKASEYEVKLPVAKPLPTDGEWRVTRPPPRPLQIRYGVFEDWIAALENGAPAVTSSYHPAEPDTSSHVAQLPKGFEDRLPSAGLQAPPPEPAYDTWVDVARRSKPGPSQIRPTKQNSPPRQSWQERLRTRSPYRRRSPPRPFIQRNPPPHHGRLPARTRYERPPSRRYEPSLRERQGNRERDRHRSRSPRHTPARELAKRRPDSPLQTSPRGRPRRRSRSFSSDSRGRSQHESGSKHASTPSAGPLQKDKGKGRMPDERASEPFVLLNTIRAAQSLGEVSAEQLQETASALLALAEQLRAPKHSASPGEAILNVGTPGEPTGNATPTKGLSIRGAASRNHQQGAGLRVEDPIPAATSSSDSVSLADRISPGLPLASRITLEPPLSERIASRPSDVAANTDASVEAWGPVHCRPIPPSAGYDFPAVKWPDTAQLDPLGLSFAACMLRFNPVSPILDDYWPERVNHTMPPVLTRGIFRLTLGSWLRFLQFKHQHPDRPSEDFLRYAMSRGIPFDLGERGELMESVDEEMPPELPSSLSFEDWRDQARILLQEPRAVQFLRDGGAIWRLALDLGREDLVADALEGVSMQRRRPLESEPAWLTQVVVDRPSARDYAVLIGATRVVNSQGQAEDRSWLPHPDLWDVLFPGEWSSATEFWYRRRTTVGATNRGKPFQPLMAHEWRKEVRGVAPVAMRPFLADADPRCAAILARLGTLPIQSHWDVDIEGEELASMSTD